MGRDRWDVAQPVSFFASLSAQQCSPRRRYDGSMSFIAILVALLLEQAKPLARDNPVHSFVTSWVLWVIRNFDAGKQQHAWLAWSLAVVTPAALVFALHWALVWYAGWVFALVLHVFVLYASLGFRQFSHHFTEIRDALAAGDEENARRLLARWMRIDATKLPSSEIVRHVTEYSVLAAHRNVFGVFVWYSLLAAFGLGPAGAVVYRNAEYLNRLVHRAVRADSLPISEVVRRDAQRAWTVMDWIPARVTALSFAFVGSFEESVDSWFKYEAKPLPTNDGVVLAATAGAINMQLGNPPSPESASPAQLAHLRVVVGLVWRTVVMWMVVLFLFSLARLFG